MIFLAVKSLGKDDVAVAAVVAMADAADLE